MTGPRGRTVLERGRYFEGPRWRDGRLRSSTGWDALDGIVLQLFDPVGEKQKM